jgi:D-aspartate ligase
MDRADRSRSADDGRADEGERSTYYPSTMSGVLLLGADYYGILAAAREFGRRGVRVVMADEQRGARALYSKYVAERLLHPPLSRPRELLEWLIDWGIEHPGYVLYPPNDSLAWLFAAERESLSKAFRLLQPPVETLLTLLDKARLYEAAKNVGITVPPTALGSRVACAEGAVPFPVLVKPRSQAYLTSGIKGWLAHDESELEQSLARFRALVSFDRVILERHPELSEPMVQHYLSEAETNILSVSGYFSDAQELVVRGATKVLQRPRKVGIGLCFEARSVEPSVVEQLRRLMAHVGYEGAFEAEFIVRGGDRLLIDFNPRFYSQLGFDIARGMSIPMLVYDAAKGAREAFKAELDRAQSWMPRGHEAYCHKTMLDLVLSLQSMAKSMSRAEAARWRAWHADHSAEMTDAVRDPDDRLPAVVDAARWMRDFARHPRSFVRSYILNR